MRCRTGVVAGFVPVLVILGACTAKNTYDAAGTGSVPETRAAIAQTDWSAAERIDLRMSEYDFVPSQLVFQSGKPYRLHIENVGSKAHSFVSEDFFRTIAVERVVSPQGTVEAPAIRRIELAAGETQDIHFVPLRPGRYDLECDEPLHSIFGMTGRIEVK